MKQKQRIFSLFLLVALVFSLAAPVSAAGEMNFTDVAPDDWYYTVAKTAGIPLSRRACKNSFAPVLHTTCSQ